MLIAIGQLFLAALACFVLFAAYRRIARRPGWAGIVGAGLIIRAVVSQALFWISYLELPIARSLQLGGGFWFFGVDGISFFGRAVSAYRGGFGALLRLDPATISPVFTNIVAVMCALFGPVPSVAILLNAFVFLGTCAAIAKLANAAPRVRRVAVAAVSFSPALIVWSTQLLKDVLFTFLIAAFVAAAAAWARSQDDARSGRAVAATAAVIAVLAAIGGIRWYVLLALMLVAAIPLAVAALRSRKRLRAFALLAAMYGVVAAAGLWTAGPFMPASIRALIVAPSASGVVKAPRLALDVVEGARTAFAALPASTTIVAGPRIASMHPAAARMISGTAALMLPLTVSQALGLFDVAGGRGLLAFVAIDTIFFDAVLLFAVAAVVQAFRRGAFAAQPLLWLVAAATLIMALTVAYCVTNYGALVRYRSMVFICLLLVPLAAAADQMPLPDSDDDTARNSSRRSSSIDQSHMYIRS